MNPTLATAAAATSTDVILHNIYNFVVEPVLFFMVTVAAVVFVWGIIEFIAGAGNEEKRRLGQKHILWGLIGLLIMLSVFGIASVIANTLDVEVPIELQ